MDEKYKKILMNKFIEFVHADRQNSQLFYSLHINKKILCEQIWLEATRQADERNSIK